MRLKYLFFSLFLVFWIGCKTSSSSLAQKKNLTITSARSGAMRFVGRVDSTDTGLVRIYWPGTAMHFRFSGRNAAIQLKDQKGENYLNVVVDGGEPSVVKLDSLKHWYDLATDLPKGEHTISIFKRTEWNHGEIDVFALRADGTFLEAPKPTGRIIEFFGNSISTGYANQDFSGNDKPDGMKTNNYTAYTAVTARALDADMICTAKAGIGVLVSWIPLIMPEMYDRLDPRDSTSHWDFEKVTPDIVVINLLQNDSWIVEKPNYVEFKHRFGQKRPTEKDIVSAYKRFLTSIRKVYPNTPILCTLGNMDATKPGSLWPAYIQEAVKQMHDTHIDTLFFPYKGTAGHPHPKDHQQMADKLVPKIRAMMGW